LYPSASLRLRGSIDFKIQEEENVIRSIITATLVAKIITTANSVDEIAAGAYCQSRRTHQRRAGRKV